MGDAKHTPGPWRFAPIVLDVRMQDWIQIVDASGANVAPITSERDIAKGNARLIAAAPTLLAVAEELAECSEYWSEYDVPLGIVERLRAAIAAAKGEG
jgi:hypothetical protein